MAGPVVTIDGAALTDENAFHDAFARALGFPNRYGRNWDAWIDLMTHLDTDFETTELVVQPGETVTILLANAAVFRDRSPDLYKALIECAAFVNWRRLDTGDPSYLCLAFAS